jgi:hypothetical protein
MNTFVVFFVTILFVFLLLNKIKYRDIVIIMSNIDNRKYICRKLPDAQLAADKLAVINQKVIQLINCLSDSDRENIERLKKRYNPDKLSETGIGAKYKSYSVNKGEEIAICVRQTNNTMIDDNTIMFVVIHELAHVITISVGHTKEFWDNMKYLLEEGEKCGVYQPIDYSKSPATYCGMKIESTPYEF